MENIKTEIISLMRQMTSGDIDKGKGMLKLLSLVKKAKNNSGGVNNESI